MSRLLSALALVALMIAPASAQTSSTTSGTSNGQQSQAQALPQQIRQKLENQGFSDVQVVPGSFIVSAKDKDGDPINMIIGPNSMMVMTTSNVSASDKSNNRIPSNRSNTESTGK